MQLLWINVLRPIFKLKNPDFAHMLCRAGEVIRISKTEREGKDCALPPKARADFRRSVLTVYEFGV